MVTTAVTIARTRGFGAILPVEREDSMARKARTGQTKGKRKQVRARKAAPVRKAVARPRPPRNVVSRTRLVTATKPVERNARRITMKPDIYGGFKIALGYQVGNLVFLSGQASLDLKTGAVIGTGNFDAQVKQVFANLRAVLKAAGSSMEQIVKVNIYLTDMKHFPKIIKARGKYFSRPWPADTIVEVGALGLPELMIEIEAIALVGGKLIG